MFLGFPYGSPGKEYTCNVGDLGLIAELEISPGEKKGYPLKYSVLENSMDCIVCGVAKSQAQLSDFHFHFLTFFMALLSHPYMITGKISALTINTICQQSDFYAF